MVKLGKWISRSNTEGIYGSLSSWAHWFEPPPVTKPRDTFSYDVDHMGIILRNQSLIGKAQCCLLSYRDELEY